jgi:hypothetical protein
MLPPTPLLIPQLLDHIVVIKYLLKNKPSAVPVFSTSPKNHDNQGFYDIKIRFFMGVVLFFLRVRLSSKSPTCVIRKQKQKCNKNEKFSSLS